MQSNGEGAKQSVKHFHIHVLPRKLSDDLKLNWELNRAILKPSLRVRIGFVLIFKSLRSLRTGR